MIDGNLSLTYVFLAGILTSFTPCVYPLIPITIAIFGASEQTSKIQAFLLSLTYVLGIAVTYSLLGLVSAQTGAIFGDFLQNPWLVVCICCVFFYLSLTTLDLAQLPFINHFQTKASRIGSKGFSGAFTMGTVSGIIAAPCIGPVLAEILLISAQSQNWLYGTSLLFVYALGFGLIFIVLGTCSSLVKQIPKAGNWLNYVKFIICVSLFLVIYFLIDPIVKLPSNQIYSSLGNTVLLSSAVLFSVLAFPLVTRDYKWLAFGLAILVSFTIYVMLFQSQSSGTTNSLSQQTRTSWYSKSETAIEAGAKLNKVTMIDLYADWCVACKELEEVTFADLKVKQALANFVLAKVDYGTESEFVKKHKVVGLPCIIFLDPEGLEIPNSRVLGFLNPQEFLDHLKAHFKID